MWFAEIKIQMPFKTFITFSDCLISKNFDPFLATRYRSAKWITPNIWVWQRTHLSNDLRQYLHLKSPSPWVRIWRNSTNPRVNFLWQIVHWKTKDRVGFSQTSFWSISENYRREYCKILTRISKFWMLVYNKKNLEDKFYRQVLKNTDFVCENKKKIQILQKILRIIGKVWWKFVSWTTIYLKRFLPCMVSHVVVKNVFPIESFRAVGTLEVLKQKAKTEWQTVTYAFKNRFRTGKFSKALFYICILQACLSTRIRQGS